MVQLFAFRRSLVALALCSAAIVASVSAASARTHHSTGRHPHHVRHAGSFAKRHYAYRHYRQYRHIMRASRWERGFAQTQAGGFGNTNASLPSSTAPGSTAISGDFGLSNIVNEARRYIGGNPTGRGSLWCARFMNLVLQHSGYRGTGSDLARSFASYGRRVSGPQIGAIAVIARRGGGGHVGVVSGIDAAGNPILVSGNNRNRVVEAPTSRGRIYAYVMPTN
jgi:uncharacterized protein (TIGR02594 family)